MRKKLEEVKRLWAELLHEVIWISYLILRKTKTISHSVMSILMT